MSSAFGTVLGIRRIRRMRLRHSVPNPARFLESAESAECVCGILPKSGTVLKSAECVCSILPESGTVLKSAECVCSILPKSGTVLKSAECVCGILPESAEIRGFGTVS